MNGQMKAKSFSLSRRTQTPPRKEESVKQIVTEDDKIQISNLATALNSPIARPSRLCSTPMRRNVEDSPDHDYQGSPTSLYPCTQDSNEIAWDWQHCAVNQTGDSNNSVDKTTKSHSTGLNHTPKRPQQLLKKKRTAKSYSPLLNVPNKRKLANSEVAESIGKFAAELQALAEKIKTDQSSEANEKKNDGEIRQENNSGTPKPLGIFDMETQNEFDIHEATTLEVSYIAEEQTDPERLESSLDDLFDDSVDACMVQCSQEIEDKLKFKSGGKGDSSNVLSRLVNCGASTSSCDQNMGTKSSCTVNIESRYQGEDRREATSSDPKLKDSKNSSKQAGSCEKLRVENCIPASQIPDDSFDDCLALCLEDDDDFARKFLEDEKPRNTLQKVKDSVTNISNSSNHAKPILNQSNQTVNLALPFKRNQPGKAPETPENRKYLKAKSLSDSYCADSGLGKNGKFNFGQNSNLGKSSAPPPMTKSTSNFNLSHKTRTNEIQNKVSSSKNLYNCIPAAGSRSNSASNLSNKQSSSTTVSYSYLRKSNDNLLTNKSNKWTSDPYARSAGLGEKSLRELRTTVPSSSQQQQYNAQEIERKRLEAKMRLEANKLRKINSSKSNGGISLQNKRPEVKR